MGKWYELNAKKTAYLLISVLLCFAVFAALQAYANQLDVASLPEEWQPMFMAFVTFMSSAGATFAISVTRNIAGYLRKYVKTNYAEAYDQKRLYSTWLYYYGIIGTAVTIVNTIELPSPYKEAVLGITTLVAILADFLFSEIKYHASP